MLVAVSLLPFPTFHLSLYPSSSFSIAVVVVVVVVAAAAAVYPETHSQLHSVAP